MNHFFIAAELVTWNPVGDQYVIGYETTLSICDVQVSNVLMIITTAAISYTSIVRGSHSKH